MILRPKVFAAFIAVAVFGVASVWGGESCSFTPSGCHGDDCVQKWECVNGICGEEGGECICDPCYDGTQCDHYVNKHSPKFENTEGKITIDEEHNGPFFQLSAMDMDEEHCPRGVECRCSSITFTMKQLTPVDEPTPFAIVDDEVIVDDNDMLESGLTYVLSITATNGKMREKDTPASVLTLEVSVSLKMSSNSPSVNQTGPYNVRALPNDLEARSQTSVGAHSRRKRDAPGDTAGSLTMTLSVEGSAPTQIFPGQSVNFKITAAIPKLTNMDFVVEIFVMDPVTGVTPFTICEVTVDDLPSAVTSSLGAKPDPVKHKNSILTDMIDRVVIDFGQISNSATVDNGGDYTDSTINIYFQATFIKNTDYSNDTAVVTAGAEYDSQNFVWVGQSEYPFELDPSFTYPSKVEIAGPEEAGEYAGASFTIDAIISDPQGPFTFEIYTPSPVHNQFTVSYMNVDAIGANLGKCLGAPSVSNTMFESVDGSTYHRGVSTFDFMMCGIDFTNLLNELNDLDNKVQLSFGIFLKDAREGDIVSVGAGIAVGSTTLWTALINVTTTAYVAPDTQTVTYTVVDIGENRDVPDFGVLTWGIVAELAAANANGLVKCSATPPADHKIAGVAYGKSGQDVVALPRLDENVVYNNVTGEVSFELNINASNTVDTPAARQAVIEISVQYLTATRSDVTVDCDGTSLTLTAGGTVAAGTEDVSGTADPINVNDNVWYYGSQQALLVKLNFPAGGVPYSAMDIETSGDYEVTAFGARICKLEIMSAGNGVPNIAGPIKQLNEAVVIDKASANAVFNDGAKLSVGPVAGVDRGTKALGNGGEVVIRMSYILPLDQTAAAVTGDYNMSMGIQFDTNLIWTGWANFDASTAAPSGADPPLISLIPLADYLSDMEMKSTGVVFFKFKAKPGSVAQYSIEASVPDVATVSICRIVILAVGSSYPCLDDDPYGKHLTDPAQPNTIIHDETEWGLKATANLGVLRNVGYQDYYADEIADQDSIYFAVVVKAMEAAGTQTLSIITTTDGTPTTETASIVVTKPLVTNAATIVSSSWSVGDSGNEAYRGIMKLMNLLVIVQDEYKKSMKFEFSTDTLDQMEICSVNIFTAGKNLPCIIPHLIVPLIENDGTTLKITIEFDACYYPFAPEDPVENTITIQLGAQLTKEGTGGTIKTLIFEDDAASTTIVPDFVVTVSATDFDPTSVNTTTDGFKAYMMDNDTTDVTPGLSSFFEIGIELPPYQMGEVEIGAMTPTDEGRAYATVNNWRRGNITGRNTGCIIAEENYEYELVQNSSLDTPMIHESQKDTFVLKLGYLTNTGLSYAQKYPQEPDDNQISVAVEVQVADHHNASTDDIITINFAVKFHDVIYVVKKHLKLVRDVSVDLFDLNNFVNFSTISYPLPDYFDSAVNKEISLTIHMSHTNTSAREANDAKVRVLLPRPIKFVEGVNTNSSNITETTMLENHYLDFDITNLFFTDYLEINVTLSVDPDNDMVKGLGLIDAAILVRLVCNHYHDATVHYCGNSAVLPFQMMGTECYDDLNVAAMGDCQFTASTAIDNDVAPSKAMSGSGGGWSPAVRGGPGWNHYINIDFLKETRVTKIVFEPVGGTKKNVEHFKIEYSSNGLAFTSACPDIINVTANEAILPSPCRFQARFGRLVIVDPTPDSSAFGVRFNWFGCYIGTVDEVCGTALTTQFTNAPGWRQIGMDNVNNIFYFCDYSPTKKKNVCFSTSDGVTWTELPGYVGSLAGEGSDGGYIAKDQRGVAQVSSLDGIVWSVTDSATLTITTPATDVPGYSEADFTTVTLGDYSADYMGIQKGGAYIAKWESCC